MNGWSHEFLEKCGDFTLMDYIRARDPKGKIKERLKMKLHFDNLDMTFREFATKYEVRQIEGIFTIWSLLTSEVVLTFIDIFEYHRCMYKLDHKKDT